MIQDMTPDRTCMHSPHTNRSLLLLSELAVAVTHERKKPNLVTASVAVNG